MAAHLQREAFVVDARHVTTAQAEPTENLASALSMHRDIQDVLKLTDFYAYKAAVEARNDAAHKDSRNLRQILSMNYEFLFDVSFTPLHPCCTEPDGGFDMDHHGGVAGVCDADTQRALRAQILDHITRFDFTVTKSFAAPSSAGHACVTWHIALHVPDHETPVLGVLLLRRVLQSFMRCGREAEESITSIFCACFETEEARDACTLDWDEFSSELTLVCPPAKPSMTIAEAYADMARASAEARCLLSPTKTTSSWTSTLSKHHSFQ